MSTVDFPRANPDERGCGLREPGGVYAECGFSPYGSPLERFVFDPPLPPPDNIDLANKPRLWQRVHPVTGEMELDDQDRPIWDLLIHIGAQHYPFAPDYYKETERLGASRRLNPKLDLSRLTLSSRMLLAHPRAIPVGWRGLLPPQTCRKHLPYHDMAFYAELYRELVEQGEGIDATHDSERVGACFFKLWDVIPQEVALQVFPQEGDLPLCLRKSGSTIYEFRPTGENVDQWEEGFILGLPITGIALIQYEDGSVNEQAQKKLQAGREQNGEDAIPFFETDR